MGRTADERREIVRLFMGERGLKAAGWARDAGVKANSLYNFLGGHSESLDLETYAKLAKAEKVPVWRLTGEPPEPTNPTSIYVVGQVEAGSFRSAVEWDRTLWYRVDVPVAKRFHGRAKALEVHGTSMNLEYPAGSIVIWVDVLDARSPHHGDHVIAYSYASDGEIEATVKELRIVGGRSWLFPRSDDPAFQTPVDRDHLTHQNVLFSL